MSKKEYKNILQSNGYINLANVVDFLKQNCIADFAAISEIFDRGMSISDYRELQTAIEEILQEEMELVAWTEWTITERKERDKKGLKHWGGEKWKRKNIQKRK